MYFFLCSLSPLIAHNLGWLEFRIVLLLLRIINCGYVVPGMKLWAMCMLGKHSANRATFLA